MKRLNLKAAVVCSLAATALLASGCSKDSKSRAKTHSVLTKADVEAFKYAGQIVFEGGEVDKVAGDNKIPQWKLILCIPKTTEGVEKTAEVEIDLSKYGRPYSSLITFAAGKPAEKKIWERVQKLKFSYRYDGKTEVSQLENKVIYSEMNGKFVYQIVPETDFTDFDGRPVPPVNVFWSSLEKSDGVGMALFKTRWFEGPQGVNYYSGGATRTWSSEDPVSECEGQDQPYILKSLVPEKAPTGASPEAFTAVPGTPASK